MSDHPIDRQWAHLRQGRRTALIPYLTAGYPSVDASLAALEMLPDCGADFVEVGIPFSDPLADGPVIQASSQVALEQGMTVGGTLELIDRARLTIPVIVFGYLNPILAFGLERFLGEAAGAGVSGLLLTDLPSGEDPEVERTIRESPLNLISLVAPTTGEQRVSDIARMAQGFIYVISRLGVTGAFTEIGAALGHTVERVRDASRLPVAIGFGISNGTQARQAAELGDGVVVGSALVRRLGEGIPSARELMNELRRSLDAAHVASRN